MSRTTKEDGSTSRSSESEVEVLYDKEKDRRARRKGQSPRRETSKRRMTKRPSERSFATAPHEALTVTIHNDAHQSYPTATTSITTEEIPLPTGPSPSENAHSSFLKNEHRLRQGVKEANFHVNQNFNSSRPYNGDQRRNQISTDPTYTGQSQGWGSFPASNGHRRWSQSRSYSTGHGNSPSWDNLGGRWAELRRWQPSALGRDMMAGKVDGFNLRVLSYNVLAQNLLHGHTYLYRNSPAYALKWEYRWEGIRSEVDDLNPDVVCLQEVQMEDPPYFDLAYKPFFSQRGFRHVAKKRTGDKKDGCVIFFKGDKFTLDCVSEMEYNIPRISVLNRDNIGLVCRLIPLGYPALPPLVFATTHLLYNPKRDDIRLAQTALLLAEIDRLATPPVEAEDRNYLPTIITGDFNCPPTSPVVQLLATGSVAYSGRRCHGNRNFPDKLVPDTLGLSDSCQWQVKLEQRGLGHNFEVGTGGLHHSLNLASVYPPGPGVSTFQNDWTLVLVFFVRIITEISISN